MPSFPIPLGVILSPFLLVNGNLYPQRALIPPSSDQQQTTDPNSAPVAPIYPNLTIREDHIDELTITRHPVEQGAAISDHAYKEPSQVMARYGWSLADAQAAGNPNYVDELYDALRAMQISRQLLTVITGKATYQNMLIASCRTHTDDETATTLFAEIRFEQLIIVSTSVVSVGSSSTMANPSSNAATQSLGTQQLGSAPNFNSSAYGTAVP